MNNYVVHKEKSKKHSKAKRSSANTTKVLPVPKTATAEVSSGSVCYDNNNYNNDNYDATTITSPTCYDVSNNSKNNNNSNENQDSAWCQTAVTFKDAFSSKAGRRKVNEILASSCYAYYR